MGAAWLQWQWQWQDTKLHARIAALLQWQVLKLLH
jgi:hypothetical protein